MNEPDRSPTWGLRYWNGHFHVHLMWMHWKTGYWTSSRSMIRKEYHSLEAALKELDGITGVVMIFPA
jgi:hypothetical protein